MVVVAPSSADMANDAFGNLTSDLKYKSFQIKLKRGKGALTLPEALLTRIYKSLIIYQADVLQNKRNICPFCEQKVTYSI